MNSEKYLDQFRTGTLVDKLEKLAKEYSGPCGQSANVMTANQLKKEIILEAIKALKK